MFWKKSNEELVRKGIEALEKRDYSTAAKHFSEAAKNDSAEGCYLLGKMYGNGLYYDYDAEKEFSCTKRAAEQGYAPAQRHLATMYNSGFYKYVKRDLNECAKWLDAALKQDDFLANGYANLYGILGYQKSKEQAMEIFQKYMSCGDIDCIDVSIEISAMNMKKNASEVFSCSDIVSSYDACYYHLLKGTELLSKDEDEALKEIQKAADKNMPDAFYVMGTVYGARGEEEKSRKFLQKAADMGFIDAEFKLLLMDENIKDPDHIDELEEKLKELSDYGLSDAMVLYGQILNRTNPDLALEYFHKAELLESEDAYFELGEIYSGLSGNMKTDYPRAFDYFMKAAEKDVLMAHVRLAEMYFDGLGVQKNSYAAFGHLLYAAEKEEPEAMFRAAFHLEEGIGCVQNTELSEEYYAKAIIAGNTNAMLKVSQKLRSSEDQTARKKGIELLEQAAGMEDTNALLLLGRSYYEGICHEVDHEKSAQLFRLGTECGHIECASYFGVQLLHGDGVEKDEALAMSLLFKAAECDVPEAQYALGLVALEKESYVDAYNFFRDAADKGYIPAIQEIAKMHQNGLGVVKDEEKAAKIWSMTIQEK